jgi:hypothetical protein
MGSSLTKGVEAPSNVYVQAFRKALDEIRGLQKKAFELKQQLSEVDLEMDKKIFIAKGLADAVAKEGDASLRREMANVRKAMGHSGRTSVAFDALRRLLAESPKENSPLTTSDILSRLKIQNIGVEPKAVYNALNYMEKIGKLRRIGRGQYLVTDGGYAVHSAHEVNRLEDQDMSD